ncbi:MAG: GNAT family N-acetyltransferase, partial [Minisyncoccales bacterium]
MSLAQLHNFFNPKTVAVIGANDREDSVGYSIFKNIKNSAFGGKAFPVNIKAKTVQGVKAYASISEIGEHIDLVIIATPAPTVLDLVTECGKAKVSGITIISSGFKEAGAEGQKMFDRIQSAGKKYGVKILGPNCLGFINPRISLNASFAPEMPNPGNIAFVSQSGALCDTFLDWSLGDNVGFSYFVSIGSMADISFDELIDYFDTDPNVTSILLYMESLNDARKFMSSARAFSKTKPIVCLKSGVDTAGVKAVASHTGTIAGDNKVFQAAFTRAGVIRAATISELFNYAKTLNHYRKPAGNRLAIVTNAGGPGVISTDFLTGNGGRLAEISQTTVQTLNAQLPPAWSKSNPIDVLGDGQPQHYRSAVQACLNDPNVDGIMITLTPQAVTKSGQIAREIANLPDINSKPVFASFMGQRRVKDGVRILLDAGIPVYRTPEKAIACFLGINEWQKNLENIQTPPEAIPAQFVPDTQTARIIMERAAEEKRFILTGAPARKFLSCYGLAANPAYLAKTAARAAAIAKKIGFPAAIKLEATGLLHKTEVNGIKLNIRSASEAKKAFDQIMESAKNYIDPKNIEGITVEKMVSKKFELIVGAKKDPMFGPVIVFGMGGVAVEVFNDVTIGLPPLNMALAKNLMEQTKIFTLLKGYRNMPGADIAELQFFLYKFSYLLTDFPQIKEIDINPLAADAEGILIVDAKVVFDPEAIANPPKPYSHLAILPYIKEYESRITIAGGQKVLLRPIMAEDEPRHREFLNNLSEESKRFRFFNAPENFDAKFARHFTQIDYERETAIIAEIEEKGKKITIGAGRLIEEEPNVTAEFAIVVADAWQRKGLGKKITDHMIRIARQQGLKKIYLSFLKDNYAIKALVKKEGFAIVENPDSGSAELNLG